MSKGKNEKQFYEELVEHLCSKMAGARNNPYLMHQYEMRLANANHILTYGRL